MYLYAFSTRTTCLFNIDLFEFVYYLIIPYMIIKFVGTNNKKNNYMHNKLKFSWLKVRKI